MSILTGQQMQLGPLTLQTSTFLVLVAALFGALLVFWRYRGDPTRRRLFFDTLTSAAVVGLLGWKLSPLFESFGEMLTNPMTLLYTPGGTPGLVFGLALGLLTFGFTILKGRRRQTAERHLLSPLLVFAVSFAGLSAVLLGSSSALRAEQPARPAPSFAAKSVEGEAISLDNLRGKTVVLNFWASWCPPCRAELPTLVAFGDELKGSQTVLVGVASGPTQTPEDLKPFIDKHRLNYPIIADTSRAISARYGVRTLPTTVVIAPDGTIAGRRTGAVDRYWLRSHLAATKDKLLTN